MKKLACAFVCLVLLYGPVAFAQNRVNGTVRDEKGPLAGVTVVVKHTTRGTQTDASGRFSIQANKSDTLVFSSAGYTLAETAVDNRNAYNSAMVTEVQSM
jgi:hypothetical protein